MFGHTWRLGRFFGVDVRVDSSWIVIALLVADSLYYRFTQIDKTVRGPAGAALAAGAAILFFTSVLVHELAHAVEARRRGIRVLDITLFLFGGATRADVESRGPRDEFLVSIVGPLTSLALAGIYGGIARLAFLPRPVAGALGYLGWVNLLLAIFNLVPGLPLDGGRVLRSIVWSRTGDLSRATRVAGQAGVGVGYVLIFLGVMFLFTAQLVSGIWFAAIGWFLMSAARSSSAQVELHHVLDGVRAGDVMERDLVILPADVTLRDVADAYFLRHDQTAYPVVDEGSAIGLLTLDDLKQIHHSEWDVRTARDSSQPLTAFHTIAPDTRMADALERLSHEGSRPLLVVHDGEIAGLLTMSDVTRWLQRRRQIAS